MVNEQIIRNITAKICDKIIDEIDRLDAQADAERAVENRKLAERMADDAALREEVIDALVAKGVTRAAAAARTNTESKLLAEGKALDII